jgi:hypothetical protein
VDEAALRHGAGVERETTEPREAYARFRPGRLTRDRSAGPAWGAYTVDEAALRHGAGVERETTEPREAYARFRPGRLTRYRDGWLPG